MNHLLNSCSYTAQLWDQVAIIMRKSDRQRESVIATIAEWRDHAFQSPLLNRIWQLLPGFILWQIWKERNEGSFEISRNLGNLAGTMSNPSWKPSLCSTGLMTRGAAPLLNF
jgi:hypothetical protein